MYGCDVNCSALRIIWSLDLILLIKCLDFYILCNWGDWGNLKKAKRKSNFSSSLGASTPTMVQGSDSQGSNSLFEVAEETTPIPTPTNIPKVIPVGSRRMARVQIPARLQAEENAVHLTVDKHDPHNLDVKLSFDGGSAETRAEVSFFFYMPSNVHLFDLDKSKLQADFDCRARLAYSRQDHATAESFKTEQDRLIESLHALIENGQELPEFMVRTYGAMLSETVRSLGGRCKKSLLLTHSLMAQIKNPNRALKVLAVEIERTWKLHEPVRVLISRPLLEKSSVLIILERYIHQVYVDFLGDLLETLQEIQRSVKDPERFQTGWEELDRIFTQCKTQEFEHSRLSAPLDQISEELTLLRLSHMKKYFQSTTFVEVNRKESLRRFSEPAAALGAAMAAILVTLVDHFRTPGSLAAGGAQGIALIAAGVALYTIKDVLKDRMRNFTLSKLTRVVPDQETELFIEKKKIGLVKEWFTKLRSTEVPAECARLRRDACVSESEKHLAEHVLSYRKSIHLKREEKALNNRAYQETLRVNIERHLKYLDDPLKSFRLLGLDGSLNRVESHRVYHFHLGVQGHATIGADKVQISRFFRIVIDKNGIHRVDSLFSPTES